PAVLRGMREALAARGVFGLVVEGLPFTLALGDHKPIEVIDYLAAAGYPPLSPSPSTTTHNVFFAPELCTGTVLSASPRPLGRYSCPASEERCCAWRFCRGSARPFPTRRTSSATSWARTRSATAASRIRPIRCGGSSRPSM